MKPIVGILGCSGAVGKMACEILTRDYLVKGGQRSDFDHKFGDNFLGFEKVDIYNSKSLKNFCKGCDVVLNCAGPSYKIKDIAAIEALEAGADYVDVFGADPLEDILKEKIDEYDSTCVISAGAFPGLSGLFPIWLKNKEFDSLDIIHLFAGGRELLSKNAAADLLLSSLKGFGTSDVFLKNGNLTPYEAEFPLIVYLSGFGNVDVQPFLHTEFINLADKLKLSETHFYNVFIDPLIHESIKNSFLKISDEEGFPGLNEATSDLVNTASSLFSSGAHWYSMMVDCLGIKNGEIVKKRGLIKSGNSYMISGAIAAMSVEKLINEKFDNGVYWAYEFLDPDTVFEKLIQTKAVESIDILDINEVAQDLFSLTEVEGEI